MALIIHHTDWQHIQLVMSDMHNPHLVNNLDHENNELLAAFERAEMRLNQFVPQAQTVTDETDES